MESNPWSLTFDCATHRHEASHGSNISTVWRVGRLHRTTETTEKWQMTKRHSLIRNHFSACDLPHDTWQCSMHAKPGTQEFRHTVLHLSHRSAGATCAKHLCTNHAVYKRHRRKHNTTWSSLIGVASLLSPPKEGDYDFTSAYLSVRLITQKVMNGFWWILGAVGRCPGNNIKILLAIRIQDSWAIFKKRLFTITISIDSQE